MSTVIQHSGQSTGDYIDFPVPAGAMQPRTTNGAEAGSEEMATNDVMVDYFDFDPTTPEGVQFNLPMPRDWDCGPVRLQLYLKDNGTNDTGYVVWSIRAQAINPGGALDNSWGDVVLVTHGFNNAGALAKPLPTPELTIGNYPQKNDMIVFEIERDADAAGDTYTEDIRLVGVAVQYKKRTQPGPLWEDAPIAGLRIAIFGSDTVTKKLANYTWNLPADSGKSIDLRIGDDHVIGGRSFSSTTSFKNWSSGIWGGTGNAFRVARSKWTFLGSTYTSVGMSVRVEFRSVDKAAAYLFATRHLWTSFITTGGTSTSETIDESDFTPALGALKPNSNDYFLGDEMFGRYVDTSGANPIIYTWEKLT